ncbi:dipeptidase PepE [Winogradskyella maritima]|uniref:Dipeptidase PepE n=1 Tax=Winogradskyella maritima TaxID=1517766 RepID=A0ABV8AFT3_9FLAO|nr:dipeptidase PepE [Winogradskyella maritima]
MANIIAASTSTVFGSGHLEYLHEELKPFFKEADEIIFIPFARPSGISYDDYTEKVSQSFSKIGKRVKGLHTFENPKQALMNAEGIFTGGGNTFVLLDQLYKLNLINDLKQSILNGTPYLGTSAGSNICGLTIGTSNDMPIVYPPSFKAMGLFSFNINPHYLDPISGNTHMGETRETRISEFHKFNPQPVIGLREGSWIEVDGEDINLRGNLQARLFKQGQRAVEIESNSDLSSIK